MIEAAGLTKVYGRSVALRGVSLAVPAGAVLTVLGHNGSGKTTLLRLLATLTRRPLGLASALGKLQRAAEMVPMDANPATAHLFIVNPLSGRSFTRLFSTHPPVEDRIARLERMRA